MFIVNVLILVAVILFITLLLTVVCRDAYHFNGLNLELDQTIFGAFFQRLYFVLTTLTTIGLGDVSPASIRAKVMLMLIIFTVLILILKSLDNIITFMRESVVTSVKKGVSKVQQATIAPSKEKKEPPKTNDTYSNVSTYSNTFQKPVAM